MLRYALAMIAVLAPSSAAQAMGGGGQDTDCSQGGSGYDSKTGKPLLICTPKLTLKGPAKNDGKIGSLKATKKVPKKSVGK
jgi:hypothetical protein